MDFFFLTVRRGCKRVFAPFVHTENAQNLLPDSIESGVEWTGAMPCPRFAQRNEKPFKIQLLAILSSEMVVELLRRGGVV